MTMYNEAQTSGAYMPGAVVGTGRPNGFVNPFRGQVRELPAVPTISRLGSTSSIMSPPNMFGGANQVSGVAAPINVPLPEIGPSVIGSIAGALPAVGAVNLARDIPNANGRPLIPVGLRERVAASLPDGIRKRAVAWERAISRRLTRASPSIPVGRE